MERLIRDLRYAARRLLKKPVFTGTTIATPRPSLSRTLEYPCSICRPN
jgi:hypothetical protein